MRKRLVSAQKRKRFPSREELGKTAVYQHMVIFAVFLGACGFIATYAFVAKALLG